MAISAANMIQFTDKLAASYNALLAGTGDVLVAAGSDTGCTRKLRDQESNIAAWSDFDVIARLERSLVDNVNVITRANQANVLLSPIFSALNTVCNNAALAGVTNFGTFVTYYNTGAGGPYGCLMCPDMAVLFPLITSVPSGTLSALNFYSPAIANMASNVSGNGTLVLGTNVDTTKYAGAAILNAVATGITGSGVATVTANGFNATGGAVTAGTWTATVTGNGTFALTPGVVGNIATAVTNVSLAAGLTAGTVTVAAAIPAGRANPPS